MILHIDIKDLVPEISQNPLNILKLRNVGIDYATSTIDAILGKYYITIFYFSDYDIKLSNRWVDYKINWGEAGITIQFISSKDVSNRKTRSEQIDH